MPSGSNNTDKNKPKRSLPVQKMSSKGPRFLLAHLANVMYVLNSLQGLIYM